MLRECCVVGDGRINCNFGGGSAKSGWNCRLQGFHCGGECKLFAKETGYEPGTAHFAAVLQPAQGKNDFSSANLIHASALREKPLRSALVAPGTLASSSNSPATISHPLAKPGRMM